MTKCTVKGCKNKYRQAGYCGRHYSQIYRYGEIRHSNRLPNKIKEYENHIGLILYDSHLLPRAECLLSKKDRHLIEGKRWCLQQSSVKNKFYVKESKSTGAKYLHQIIMTPPRGMDVDHINGDRLDNRRENLRICTRSQNLQNKKVVGVNYHKQYGKWRAYTTVNLKQIHFGWYNTKKEARRGYLDNILKYRDFVRT